jgi:CRISPR-associated protein Cmr4
MFQISKPLFFICETPLHAGSGSDLGIVDLPIQREKHTGFPKIESSSLKGAIREAVEGVFIKEDAEKAKERKNPIVTALFGPEDSSDAHMGALGFSDARLLLFPVKSMKGVFAWVTCPKVLQQFERDMRISNEHFKLKSIPANPNDGECYLLTEDSKVTIPNGQHKSVLLEEYAFKVQSVQTINVIEVVNTERGEMDLHGWLACYTSEQTFFQDKMMEDIVILSNDDFKDFVNLSTEVITRTKINNDTGTVQPGALFTEEFLPAESVLYSLIMASPTFRKEKGDLDTADKVMAKFTEVITKLPVMQIGGNATLGKGIVRTKIV